MGGCEILGRRGDGGVSAAGLAALPVSEGAGAHSPGPLRQGEATHRPIAVRLAIVLNPIAAIIQRSRLFTPPEVPTRVL